MNNITKFDYEGQSISFEFSDGNKMINATQMAKPFGKKVGNFLQNKETKEYVLILEERYNNPEEKYQREVLRVIKGGDADSQGTWMDEKLALKFAAWLNPRFELWVFDRIYELLTTGKTELKKYEPSGVIKSLRLITQQLEEQEHINQEVKEELDVIAERLDVIESKIISVDDNYYTIAGYCNLKKIPCPLHKAKEWGKIATMLSREKQIPTGIAHDERFGKVRTYHQEILREVVKQ